MKLNNTVYIISKVLVTVISIHFCFNVYSQSTQYKNYEHIYSEYTKLYPGISQNDINCILQDKPGFLWLGTWDGLNKYNGYKFSVFRPDLFKPENSITHRSVNALFEDKSGFIWIGTDQGLNKYNRKNSLFTHYRSSQNNQNFLINDSITSITQDKIGNIWVGTKGGVFIIDKNDKIHKKNINGNKSKQYLANQINFVYCDNKGLIWIGSSCTLHIFDPGKNSFLVPKCLYSLLVNSNLSFNCLTNDKSNNYWLGTDDGIICFNLTKGIIKHYKSTSYINNLTGQNQINCIELDIDGLIWAGTNGFGITIIDPANMKIVTNTFSFLKDLEHYYIKSIYSDRNGILWIGSTWQGLIKFDRNAYYFTHYIKKEHDNSGLNSSLVWAFYEDKSTGLIWIATNNGINIFNPKTEKFQYIKANPENKNSLSGNLIRDIIKDSKGIFWISTFGFGLNSYDPIAKKFTHYLHSTTNKNSISCDYVWKTYEDKFGQLWIGTDCGLNLFDRKNKVFKHYYNNVKDNKSLTSNSVFSIYEDSKGNLWFSTYNGLNLYNRKQDNFSVLKHLPGQNSLSISSVFSVFEDKNGILWIGTFGGGLNMYDPRTKVFWAFTEKNGLANNIVYRILEDNNGYLWLSTNHGISRFDPRLQSFVNYGVNDGVQSFEFNHNAALKSSDGSFYFGGMNGFNRFFPENVIINKNKPSVVISSFSILNVEQNIELADGDTLILNFKENFVRFEFSGLDFSNPVKNRYKYVLKNFQKKWTVVDAEHRIAEFTKLPAGTYVFTVIASNNDGIWNNRGIHIYLIVKPPWWQTWWFITFCILMFLLTIYLIVIFYLFRIKTKHDMEKKMLSLEKDFIEAQQKALRYQMNPHFIFNSMNSIQNFILQKKEEAAHLYLANFSSLMRKILENSKHNQIALQEEIDTIKLYLELESMRFDKKFTYKINISKEINVSVFQIPPMLIQPYLENAIWHGLVPKNENGEIIIDFNLFKQKTLLICITDNGIGREKASEISSKRKTHKPTGMRNIEERLELMNRINKSNLKVKVHDLKNENGEAQGTKVELYIQYLKDK